MFRNSLKVPFDLTMETLINIMIPSIISIILCRQGRLDVSLKTDLECDGIIQYSLVSGNASVASTFDVNIIEFN